ncbi:MAG: DUF4359 domain-containing protein [Mucinivorans sp.]
MIVIAVVMCATNPSQEQHIDNAYRILKERHLDDLGINADYLTIGQGLLGKEQMDNLLKKFISRDNYYLFSLTKIDLGDKTRTVGIGLLGHIFTIDDL